MEAFADDTREWMPGGVVEMVWRCATMPEGKRYFQYTVAGGDFENGEGWRGRFDQDHLRKPGSPRRHRLIRANRVKG